VCYPLSSKTYAGDGVRYYYRPSEEERLAVIAKYLAGESTYVIGREFGWQPEKVGFWLKRWGLVLRPVGFQKGQRSPRYIGDPEHTRQVSARWRKANPDKVRKSKRNQMLRLEARLACSLRTRLNVAIRKNYKAGSAVRDLGCSIAFFIEYIKSQFAPGMSWENWGRGAANWNLDHKRPLASFDLTDREQFLAACHYTNIQPLWATDNAAKRDRRINPVPLGVTRVRKTRQALDLRASQMQLL
jgi:hypothetical protein